MIKVTIRLPDDTAERLRSLARARGLSVNKLMEELSTQAIASFDAESRFRAVASRAGVEKVRRILDRLDAADQ